MARGNAIMGKGMVSQLPPWKRPFDVNRRYVRFQQLRADGYVEFAFAIGDPELAVDLILPLADYRDFCRTNQVTYLTIDETAALDAEQAKWRFGRAEDAQSKGADQ